MEACFRSCFSGAKFFKIHQRTKDEGFPNHTKQVIWVQARTFLGENFQPKTGWKKHMFHLCSWLVDLPPSNVSPWGNQWFISPQYTTPFSLPCWWWSTHSKVGSYLHRGENNSSYPFISGHLGWKNQPKKKCPWTFYLPLVFFLKPQWTAGTLLWPQVRGFLFSDWGLACENFCFDNWGLKETIFPGKKHSWLVVEPTQLKNKRKSNIGNHFQKVRGD